MVSFDSEKLIEKEVSLILIFFLTYCGGLMNSSKFVGSLPTHPYTNDVTEEFC